MIEVRGEDSADACGNVGFRESGLKEFKILEGDGVEGKVFLSYGL